MTTVVLRVVPTAPVPVDRFDGAVPADLAALLTAHGQSVNAALSRRGSEDWRLDFQVTGPDRLATGSLLEASARRLGYTADLQVSR